MHALKVLELFKESGMQTALVVDEYGSIEGMVTINDIVEAIIGDTVSADESEESGITQREDGSWLMDGMLPIDEVKEFFHIRKLPDHDEGAYNTLGGFMMMHLKRIPSPGDYFEWGGLRFEVMDMDGSGGRCGRG
jgi:putative hemolysin